MSQHLRLAVLTLLLVFTPRAEAAGRKLAVVVGVDTYRSGSGLPSLEHATSDARSLAGVLRENGFTVYEMTHETARRPGAETLAPTIAYVRDQIDGVLGFPNLGPDDVVVVSLHGHGVQFAPRTGDAASTPRFYFCPADSTIAGLGHVEDVSERNHLLPLEELYMSLGRCEAATKLLVIDACRNDPTRPSVFREGLASATLPKLPPPPGGTIAFFSCKENERAVEDPRLRKGVFTHFLVSGLRGAADQPAAGRPGDGIVTCSELATYVANNTYQYVFDTYRTRQTPRLRGEFDLTLPLARVVRNAKLDRIAVVEAGGIYDIAFSPDSKLVATRAPEGGGVQVLRTGDGGLVKLLDDEESYMTRLAFTPDGERLIAERWRTVFSYRTNDWSLAGTTPFPQGVNGGFALSRNGSVFSELAQADDDDETGILTIARTTDGEVLREIRTGDEFAGCRTAWSPDGRSIAASKGAGVGLWSTKSGAKLFELPHPARVVRDLEFSPNGRSIVVSSIASNSDYDVVHANLRLWDLETRAPIVELDRTGEAAPDSFSGLHQPRIAFGPRGESLVVAVGDERVVVLDTANGTTIRTLDFEDVAGVAHHPSEDVVAITDGSTLQIVHTITGQRLGEYVAPNGLGRVEFSPDGHVLATATTNGVVLLRLELSR